MDITPFIAPIATALCAFAGSYMAFSTRLTRVETKLDVLSERVERHNSVMERTARLEQENRNIYHQLDDLKAGI